MKEDYSNDREEQIKSVARETAVTWKKGKIKRRKEDKAEDSNNREEMRRLQVELKIKEKERKGK